MEKFKVNKKTLVVMGCLLFGVVVLGEGEAEGSKFINMLQPIIGYGLKITGGFIGLFGGVQFAMAYLQSNPTAYADAGKKIVAGGMLVGIGVISADFLKVAG